MAQNAAAVIQESQQNSPKFGERTAALLADPALAVGKLLEVFITSNQWRHPSYEWGHPMSKTIEIFNQFTSMHADTVRALLRRFDLPTLAVYFEHTAVFLFCALPVVPSLFPTFF